MTFAIISPVKMRHQSVSPSGMEGLRAGASAQARGFSTVYFHSIGVLLLGL
jgi:hypothetical protein